MATIPIIELRTTDSGEKFYPLTHVKAVIGLEDSSFFTLDENGNVTLKSGYQNFWVPGWMAAGGVGTGGGGGGGLINTVYGVSDLGTKYSGTEDLTATFSAKAIDTIWNGLQNTYTKAQVDALVGGIHNWEPEVVSTLPAASIDTMYKLYLVPSSDPQTQNIKDEYITLRSGTSPNYTYTWEQIGSTAIDISSKADIVSGATAGHLASLTSGGNLADSGYSSEDFLTASGEVIIGTQTAATASWTGTSRLATATDFKSGYRFTYWLPYAGVSGTTDTLTLTFQDGTTKTINCYYRGSTRLTTHIPAGNKIDFLYLENAPIGASTYTGAWIDPGYYSDSNYYDRVLSSYERRFIYSTATPLYRTKICGYNGGKIVPLVVTNQTSATIVDKTPTTVGIDPSMGLVVYNNSTNVTSTTTAISLYLYNEFPVSAPTYTFNDNLPTYVDVFLKGTVEEDGLFYLDTTTHKSWYVFAPNNPSNGKYESVFTRGCYYMYVGTTSSTADQMQLKYYNPVYLFDGNRLVPLDEVGNSLSEIAEFYSRPSPSVDRQGYQIVSELRGRSLVWNQLLSAPAKSSSTKNGVTVSVSNGNLVISTVSGGATAATTFTNYFTETTLSFSQITGHKYYCPKTLPDGVRFAKNNYSNGIILCNGAITEGYRGSSAQSWSLIIDAGTEITTAVTCPILIYDLTLMFGAGNELTSVYEFKRLFPDDSYSYNAGTLLSSAVTGIKTTNSDNSDYTTLTLNIPTMKANNVVIFPDGMKSAGAVYDYAKVDDDGYIRKVVKCVEKRSYASGDESDSSVLTDGTNTVYALTTPVQYTLDTPVYVGAKYYEGGTQSVLPAQSGTPTIAPFRGVIKYGLTAGNVVSMMEKYLPLTGGTLTGPLTVNSALGVTGDSTFSGSLYGVYNSTTYWSIDNDGSAEFDSIVSNSVKIGNAYLVYDSTNKALRVYGTDSNVTIGFYCDGWVAAGGIGSGSGSGGALEDLADVELTNEANGDLLRYNGTKWVNIPQSSIMPTLSVVVPSTGNALTGVSYSNGTFTYTTGTFLTSYTETDPVFTAFLTNGGTIQGEVEFSDAIGCGQNWQIDEVGDASFASVTVNGSPVLTSHQTVTNNAATLTAGQSVTIASIGGTPITVGVPSFALASALSDYVPTSRTINGVDLSANRTFYALGTSLGTSAERGTMLGVSAISYDLSSTGSETSLLKWDAQRSAWHVYGNLYADGWVAAGGIGTESGGGGYGVESITTNEDGTVDFHFTGGDITTVDLNHTHEGLLPTVTSSNNGKIMKVVNGAWALADESGGGGNTVAWGTGAPTNSANLSVDGVTKTLLLTSGLVTSLSSSSTDFEIPSAKCVYDLVGTTPTFYTGTTDPSSSLGSDGDVYLKIAS